MSHAQDDYDHLRDSADKVEYREEHTEPYDVDTSSPEYRGACEVITRYEQVSEDDTGLSGRRPVYCGSRDTTRYIDIWGAEHWPCSALGHGTRLRSWYPESIQRMLYEDVMKQGSLLPNGPVGGTLRPNVKVTDDSDYLRGAKRGIFRIGMKSEEGADK